MDSSFREAIRKVTEAAMVPPPIPPPVAIPEKTDFVARIDPSVTRRVPDLWRPQKVVVVAQDPDPGDQVPAGTAVSITTTVKDSLPFDFFPEIEPAIATRFPDVGVLVDAVEAIPDTRAVLETAKPYQDLSAVEKASADKILTQVLAPNASVADKARVYEDIKFAYHL